MESSILTQSDFNTFLASVRFRHMTDSNLITRCVRAGYLDLSRTLHGLRVLPSRELLRRQARKYLRDRFTDIKTKKTIIQNQQDFDDWHKSSCQGLISLYNDHKFKTFHKGQAQKWINMTYKYVFTLGEDRLPGFAHLYSLCHVPLDIKIINNLEKFNPPVLSTRWSRIDDHQEYMAYQKWVRKSFSIVPLDVEFIAWPGNSVEVYFQYK